MIKSHGSKGNGHTCSANPEPSYVNIGIATAAYKSGAEVFILIRVVSRILLSLMAKS
ncbi:MAG: hypothetical protein JETT_1080 [Candidatus Jettenia ecosi]|uniref:Uncharacterized protein n=1 Tax=Candidatus Jettenia ecosi TaxID=2494326 RepID=A0A533QCZ9_9BACT|nr:MAG: hypothetical protein JETT_1080 [Candidatus Jettenia ecosi]